MKTFKILGKVFLIAAAALFLASLVICAVDLQSPDNPAFLAFVNGYMGLFALATVGTFLLTASSEVAQKVGHGLVISSYVIGLTAAITFIEGSSAAMLMLVAAVLLAFYYLCRLVLFVTCKSVEEPESPNDDIRIVHVKEWKEIMDQGIISPGEFEEKRCQILGIKKAAAESRSKDKPKD